LSVGKLQLEFLPGGQQYGVSVSQPLSGDWSLEAQVSDVRNFGYDSNLKLIRMGDRSYFGIELSALGQGSDLLKDSLAFRLQYGETSLDGAWQRRLTLGHINAPRLSSYGFGTVVPTTNITGLNYSAQYRRVSPKVIKVFKTDFLILAELFPSGKKATELQNDVFFNTNANGNILQLFDWNS